MFHKIIFNRQLFLQLSLGFIIATVAGTLCHEGGHWAVMKAYGWKDASIHYAYTSSGKINNKTEDQLLEMWKPHMHDSFQKWPVADQVKYKKLYKIKLSQYLWIWIGGPLETMLAGTVGFLLILRYKRGFKSSTSIAFKQWLLVFLAFSWLRQVSGLVLLPFRSVIHLHLKNLKGARGDEYRIASMLHWPPSSLMIASGIIGLAITAFIFFRFIPKTERFTFFCSGITGCVAGVYLWFFLIGPQILP